MHQWKHNACQISVELQSIVTAQPSHSLSPPANSLQQNQESIQELNHLMPMKSVLEYSCTDHIFLLCFLLYKRLNSGNTQNSHSGQPTVLQKDDQIFLASHPTHLSIRNRSWPRAGIHLELFFLDSAWLFKLCAQELVLGDNSGINHVSTKPQVNVITAIG